MAKKFSAGASEVPDIDPNAYYDVNLAKVCEYARMKMRPRDNPHRMKGKALVEVLDAAASWAPAEED